MLSKNVKLICLLSLLGLSLFPISVAAQSNELAVTFGGYFPINSPVDASNAFAIGGSFAHRVAGLPLVSAYLEIPVFATFDSTANAVSTINGSPKYSTLFVTPGLKLKLAPEFPVSPYLVVGGGVVHFSKSNVTTDQSSYSGTFDVGGGLDFKIAPFFSARGEVRDYYSGSPNVTTNFTHREHQLITSVGLVFRF
jgi:opacity protein-like surface antigen